jgi:hypothetical protein
MARRDGIRLITAGELLDYTFPAGGRGRALLPDRRRGGVLQRARRNRVLGAPSPRQRSPRVPLRLRPAEAEGGVFSALLDGVTRAAMSFGGINQDETQRGLLTFTADFLAGTHNLEILITRTSQNHSSNVPPPTLLATPPSSSSRIYRCKNATGVPSHQYLSPAPSPVPDCRACCSQSSAGSAGGDARGNNNGPSPGRLCDARAPASRARPRASVTPSSSRPRNPAKVAQAGLNLHRPRSA